MEKFFKIMCLVAISFVVCGFAHKQYVKYTTPTETKTFVERVHSGDTFNGIIENYYDSTVNDCWDEWQTQQKKNNKQLFANGRVLQPGDRIVIVTKVRVAK